MRSHPPGANVELARAAAEFGPPVVGFDLAGPEATYPAPPHAAAFRAAADGGLALTAHAGEVPGPERIREVLAFGVRRIAHGATTADDPELLARCASATSRWTCARPATCRPASSPALAAHPLADSASGRRQRHAVDR